MNFNNVCVTNKISCMNTHVRMIIQSYLLPVKYYIIKRLKSCIHNQMKEYNRYNEFYLGWVNLRNKSIQKALTGFSNASSNISILPDLKVVGW